MRASLCLLVLVLLAGWAQAHYHSDIARALRDYKYQGRPWNGPANHAGDGGSCFQDVHDVCVVGAGAAGMSMAAFVKDAGKDVVVIEKADDVGGYCNTMFFTPPAPGYPAWIDLGVGIFPNSSSANASGYGNWKLDTVAFATRFASGYAAGAVVPLTTIFSPSQYVDFEHGVDLGVQTQVPPPEYLAALGRFIYYVGQYPFLNQGVWPDPIPAELLLNWNDWVAANDFQILGPGLFQSLVVIGGFVDLDNTPAIYPLANMASSILDLFLRNNTIFVIYNGCYQIYDGIRNYLGTDKVLTGTTIRRAIRPRNPRSRQPIQLQVQKGGRLQQIYCKNLVVAHPQLLSDLSYLDLDFQERSVFNGVGSYLYYAAAFNYSGGSLAGQPFQVVNFNPANQYGYPNFPAVVSASHNYPYGPAGVFACAKDPISNAGMQAVIQQQLSQVPALFGNAVVSNYVPHEKFCPHFQLSELQSHPNIYSKLEDLQGHRNTYWIGALRNFANSGALWDLSLKFLEQYPELLQ